MENRKAIAFCCDSAGGTNSAAAANCSVAALDLHVAHEREDRRRNLPPAGSRSAAGIAASGRLRRDQPVHGNWLGQAGIVSPLARDRAADADRLYLSPYLHAWFSRARADDSFRVLGLYR